MRFEFIGYNTTSQCASDCAPRVKKRKSWLRGRPRLRKAARSDLRGLRRCEIGFRVVRGWLSINDAGRGLRRPGRGWRGVWGQISLVTSFLWAVLALSISVSLRRWQDPSQRQKRPSAPSRRDSCPPIHKSLIALSDPFLKPSGGGHL